MGYERFIFWFGSPQQQVDMHALFSYNMHLFLPYLLNDFNDSFSQAPPLRDANLR